jgi:hypothetical protein
VIIRPGVANPNDLNAVSLFPVKNSAGPGYTGDDDAARVVARGAVA